VEGGNKGRARGSDSGGGVKASGGRDHKFHLLRGKPLFCPCVGKKKKGKRKKKRKLGMRKKATAKNNGSSGGVLGGLKFQKKKRVNWILNNSSHETET